MLASHPLAGPGLRYGMTGVIVAMVYIGTPVVLNGLAGLPIQAVIPIAYVLAVSLHFTLQRYFVFRHVDEFALTKRQQIGRYISIGAVQYPTTAVATALIPHVIGISARAAYVLVVLTMSFAVFLVLRTHIFHPTEIAEPMPSAGDLEVAERELLGGARGMREHHADAVESPVQLER
jgi:putative flippase GtrA